MTKKERLIIKNVCRHKLDRIRKIRKKLESRKPIYGVSRTHWWKKLDKMEKEYIGKLAFADVDLLDKSWIELARRATQNV